MMRGAAPCTALTFTKNCGEAMKPCLESALFCAEHLLLDGGSTDDTLRIAASYECRVEKQDSRFLSESGRIMDWSGISNQGVAFATHPWILLLDADELLDAELMSAIEDRIHANEPGVFLLRRLYTLGDRVFHHASTYPNLHPRLYHKDVTRGYVKPIHERLLYVDGVKEQLLPGIQYVPLDSVADLKRKSDGYIQLEIAAMGKLSWAKWFKIAFHKFIRILLRLLRILRSRLLHRWTYCLPLRYEYLHVRYPFLLIIRSCPLFRSSASSREAQG